MFKKAPRTGMFERVAFIAAYVLAVALGEHAAGSPGDDWEQLKTGLAEATQLYVRFSDEVCMFTNVFVGDGAIRVAANCALIHGVEDGR